MKKRFRATVMLLAFVFTLSCLTTAALAVDKSKIEENMQLSDSGTMPSPYAGQTMQVLVYDLGTNTPYPIQVSIPQNATVKMQRELIDQAALFATEPQLARGPVITSGEVLSNRRVTIGSGGMVDIGSFICRITYERVIIQLCDYTTVGNPEYISLDLVNDRVWYNYRLSIQQPQSIAVVVHNMTPNVGSFDISAGSRITVDAMTNVGSMTFDAHISGFTWR